MIVYRAFQKSTGKNYIGATKFRLSVRRQQHEHADNTSLLTAAILQFGKDDFEWSVLWRGSLEEAAKKECECIRKFNALIPNGFNRVLGHLYRRKRQRSPGKTIYMNLTVHALNLIDRMVEKEGVSRDEIIASALREMAEKYGVAQA